MGMTPEQLASLHFFREGERNLAGVVLDWAKDGHYETMRLLEHLRGRLDAPLSIIRLAHPAKQTAVDWCCTARRYRDVVSAVLRLPQASYGFYSGNSVHVDLRVSEGLSARWLAVKEHEKGLLFDAGLGNTIYGNANGWLYLQWTWDGLQFVIELAEKNGGAPSGN